MGPEDVVLVLVAAPVLVGRGSAASAVLCEGGGGIDLSDEKKKGCPKDVACFFRRMGSLDRSALFVKGLYGFPGSFRFISLPIQGYTQGEEIIFPFIGRGKSEALLIGHLPVSDLRTHLLPSILDLRRRQVAADDGGFIGGVPTQDGVSPTVFSLAVYPLVSNLPILSQITQNRQNIIL